MPTMTQSDPAPQGEPGALPVVEVTGGVDTHKDTHTAAALDAAGRTLGSAQFGITPAGYAALLAWLRAFGTLVLVGIEGTGVYGAGLASHLRAAGVAMVEIDRPDRKTRRWQGKSDPVDAEAAARTALAGRRTGIPKHRDGAVEALRVLRVARRSAVAGRADAQRRMKALVVTAPDTLRTMLRELGDDQLVTACATRRPDRAAAGDPTVATVIALRSLARRHQQLTIEIGELEALITPLTQSVNPTLCGLFGVGPDVAGQLLVTAGENPQRLHSEAAFAMLCGVAPLPASSGRTHRHRLNRGGDRHANCALHRIVICRLRWDPRSRAYAEKRTAEGMSKKEIIRCLKRYVSREVYTALLTPRPFLHPGQSPSAV
jgi:transposase